MTRGHSGVEAFDATGEDMTKIEELAQHGQAIWYDFIRRDMLTGSGLEDLVRSGIRGVTSNPSIFEKAIAGTDLYDEQIASLASITPESAFEALAIADIRAAADILEPVWRESDGVDGYVSLEVSPRLANDTDGTVAEARRLWAAVDRPNLMVKVPATSAGIPAIEQLTSEGININATLMFSLDDYEAVAQAYVAGARACADPSTLASVASFFVSRVDTATDDALEKVGTDDAMERRRSSPIAGIRRSSSRTASTTCAPAAPGPNGSCGPPPRPRIRAIEMSCTWRSSSAPTRSTPHHRRRSRRSRSTAS